MEMVRGYKKTLHWIPLNFEIKSGGPKTRGEKLTKKKPPLTEVDLYLYQNSFQYLE